ncbi:hypothetical protein AB4K20DRAFT_1986436 [Rhizopus microsporus]|uniref:Uncharacterized protein n=1 Tax=Rhizopus microsporus TaxID=58291 RepID=A0A1X0RVS4_RHIZD|nr:hypothetical protein BCV71DRAFT_256940 [Rhizopus microsporus]
MAFFLARHDGIFKERTTLHTPEDYELPTGSLFKPFIREFFRMFIFFVVIYSRFLITEYSNTEYSLYWNIIVDGLHSHCFKFPVIFAWVVDVYALLRNILIMECHSLNSAVVDRILDELKRKCALCERRSFFHPHSSLPIRHFYSQFIQVYPEQVDLWEEVFNIIENHRDAVTIRRVEDGEEVDVWNYGPYVLNFM